MSLKNCQPQGLCSWDFFVHGMSTGSASLDFNWFSEQGSIRIAGRHMEVVKHGFASGRWTLEQAGQTVAEAYKPAALFRRFEIHAADLRLELKAQSALGRAFELRSGHQRLGYIEPCHAFTRRATLVCDDRVPDPVQLLAFWLVVTTWRRQSNAAASSG